MKQILISVLFFAVIVSCDTPDKQQTNENPKVEPTDLLGPITRTDLQKAPFNDWFNSGYQYYQPDSTIISNINLDETSVLTFMGTWCSDSQREVPHLFKILDATNFPKDSIKILAVNEDKTQPEAAIKKWGIEYVPTIIFLKKAKEIGRIVESPAETLEKDMLLILEER